MSDGSWGPDPISTELLRDSDPWVWALPTLVRALNDARGPWSPDRRRGRPVLGSGWLMAAISATDGLGCGSSSWAQVHGTGSCCRVSSGAGDQRARSG